MSKSISYRGFIIECERTEASLYSWCVVGTGVHVYHCGGREYESSGEAETAAEQWIDWYIKSLPNTDTIKIALRIQERIKAIEEELQKLILPNADHLVIGHLLDALENISEALKINEQKFIKHD